MGRSIFRKESFFHLLPSPFSIAVLLTLFTFLMAFFYQGAYNWQGVESTAFFWEKGFWELLKFTMQMALVLILGHALAMTPFINKITSKIATYGDTTSKAAFIVGFCSIGLSFINWGLCLITGALLARKVGENASLKKLPINYPLVAAAGYAGMMTWHGGLSGSAPLTVTQSGHFLEPIIGLIEVQHTIFSLQNILLSTALLLLVPLFLYWIGNQVEPTKIPPLAASNTPKHQQAQGAEKLDYSRWFSLLFGILMVCISLLKAKNQYQHQQPLITLDSINFLFFGMGILLHKNFDSFLRAIGEGVKGASGIIVQFPLYAGIMGIIKYSGLGVGISEFFIAISSKDTLNYFTFISAGILNILVPSGGGQWAIQGEILVKAAQDLQVSVPSSIMALSYGDQLTNMLQPFWALPLLGITKLKGREIYKFSSWLFLLGFVIFSLYILIISS